MEKGRIIKGQYDRMGDYYYLIKTSNGKKIKSNSYSKFCKRLKKDEEINYEIVNKKAKILDSDLIIIQKMTKREYIYLFLLICIIICVTVLYLFKIINKNMVFIILISVPLILFIKTLITALLVYKNGIVQNVLVMKKVQINHYASDSNNLSMNYSFKLTVKTDSGKELVGTIGFSKETNRIKVGDTIKVRIYNDIFVLEEKI